VASISFNLATWISQNSADGSVKYATLSTVVHAIKPLYGVVVCEDVPVEVGELVMDVVVVGVDVAVVDGVVVVRVVDGVLVPDVVAVVVVVGVVDAVVVAVVVVSVVVIVEVPVEVGVVDIDEVSVLVSVVVKLVVGVVYWHPLKVPSQNPSIA
jgi:hypothetical protein